MFKQIQTYDLKLFWLVNYYSNYFSLHKVARTISSSADGWIYLSIIPISLIIQTEQSGNLLFLYAIGMTLERTTYYLLKNSFKRKRPYDAISQFKSTIKASDQFSLPSGHTSAAFFFTTFLCLSCSLAFLPIYLWAFSVAASRVVLGVHFPMDVFLGALLGFSIAVSVL